MSVPLTDVCVPKAMFILTGVVSLLFCASDFVVEYLIDLHLQILGNSLCYWIILLGAEPVVGISPFGFR